MQRLAPAFITSSKGDILEVSLHKPNALIQRELDYYLNPCKSVGKGPSNPVLILSTCQESSVDLVNWDSSADCEKDRLLDTFVDFANELCRSLQASGYWADFADPASGLLALSPGQIVWSEVHALERLRGFKMTMVGRCHIILHPKWGTRMYPASLFTDAPENEVVSRLLKYTPAL